MCGIAGLFDSTATPLELDDVVRRMTATLVHRGPDDDGYAVDAPVALGMRRLSIIDVAGGAQPLCSEDGMVQVVCNGEIYNHLELRRSLVSTGHVFRSRSDVEVIAHLYEELGDACVRELRGMFALAIWDGRRRRLVLARDRLGKKPLFHATVGDRLLFGSEMKAILAAAPALHEHDETSLWPYLKYGFVPEPRTIFKRIEKVPAAHILTRDADALKVEPYWHLDFEAGDDREVDVADLAEELDELLAESVRMRLMSDVPLGVFLSGGLDSSSVVAYASRAQREPLRTFTIGFDRKEWDESADAKIVADRFRTDHHVLMLRESDMADGLAATVELLVRHFDEPFGDSSALPTYHVSRLAREHVKVILGGDGGDELFAGYSLYRGMKFADYYRRLPTTLARSLPAVVGRVAPLLPSRARYKALRVERVLSDSSLPFELMYFTKTSVTRDAELRRLMSPDLLSAGDTDGAAASLAQSAGADWPALSKASFFDLRFGLLNDMLVKVDRMSMANSLEVRSPFLDHRLVEFVARLPPASKLRGWTGKAILRDAIGPDLPPQTLRKNKQGFAVPLREWLKGALRPMVADYLEADGRGLPSEVFDRRAVQSLLRRHQHGVADHSAVIWLLLIYAKWYDLYIRNAPVRHERSVRVPVVRQAATGVANGARSVQRGPEP
jgi:asparagine synthase (glutamine-hydrolysing)